MVKNYLFVILFFCLLKVEAQNKKKFIEFSFGFQYLQNTHIVTVQPFFDCANGAYFLSDIKEKGLVLPNLSILRYSDLLNQSLHFISGFSFNQKGYIERGVITPW